MEKKLFYDMYYAVLLAHERCGGGKGITEAIVHHIWSGVHEGLEKEHATHPIDKMERKNVQSVD